ncbi:short transient receptor potential channel 4-like [Ptychodera flava]|uniref:short transient receptor potential channel 4-like n=1 Tax=Ptychodera flava TaxID=63121 RepID=UPI00396AA041
MEPAHICTNTPDSLLYARRVMDGDAIVASTALFPLTSRQWNYLAAEKQGQRLRAEEVSFLWAVENGDVEQVKNLLESGRVNVNCTRRRQRLPVCALQVAAEKNDFPMVKLLLERGATPLRRPAFPNGTHEDLLDDEMRLQTYHALCSPAYLSFAYKDPVAAAMLLSGNLRSLTRSREIADTSKSKYKKMRGRVKLFALDVLKCCQTSEEVSTLMNGEVNQTEECLGNGKPNLTTLRRAVNASAKEFVAHYKCQKVVKREWLRGQPDWHTRNGFGWTILYAIYCFFMYACLMPFFALIYVVAPCSPIKYLLDTPKAKFIARVFAYLEFLVLIMTSKFVLPYNPTLSLAQLNEILTAAVLIFAVGFLWAEVGWMYVGGLKAYFSNFLNYVNIAVLLVIFVDFGVALLGELVDTDIVAVIALDLLSAVALVLICLRFLENCLISAYLGPLLLLFVSMRKDVTRFFCLFAVTVFSFALGFNYLYYGLDGITDYAEIGGALSILFTTIFGTEGDQGLNVAVTYNDTSSEKIVVVTDLFRVMGYTMYVAFGVTVIIILVNLCIALMSDTYARMKEHIDVEWKFVRTQIWLRFVDAPVLPPPFNVIPSVSCIVFPFSWLCRSTSTGHQSDEVGQGTRRRSKFKSIRLSYSELLPVLLNRYAMKKKIVKGEEYLVLGNSNSPSEGAPIQTDTVNSEADTSNVGNGVRNYAMEIIEPKYF